MSGRRGGRRRPGGRGRRQPLPGVCRHYSSPRGCVKEDSCNFLHICRNLFDDGGCRFGSRCRYSHDFTDDQPSEMLEKHRIDPYQDLQDLIDLLRQRVQAQFAAKKRDQNENEESDEQEEDTDDDAMSQASDLGPALRFYAADDYNREHDDEDDETSSVSSAFSTASHKSGNRGRGRGNGRRRPRYPKKTTNNLHEALEDQPNQQEKTEICTFHVKGHCRNEEDCPKLHRPSPYQWQSKRGERWLNFDKPRNDLIEALYCDPSNNEVKIQIRNVSYTIEFDTMSMCKTSLDYAEIRRLSTIPTAKNQIKNMKQYCTHWVWYWADEDDGMWLEYSNECHPNQYSKSDSISLERAYQDYLHRKTSKRVHHFSSGNSIDFADMTLTTHEQEQIHICRRPKLYEPNTTSQIESKGAKETKSIPESGNKASASSEKVNTQQPAEKMRPTQKSQRGTSNNSARTMDEQDARPKSTLNNITNETTKQKPNKKQQNPPEEMKEEHTGARLKKSKSTMVTEYSEQIPSVEPPIKATQPQPPEPKKAERVAKRRCSWSDDKAHEICIGELQGKCKYGVGCKRLHGKFPYQWQYRDINDRWISYDDEDNQGIEQSFSDPTVEGLFNRVYFNIRDLTVTTDCLHYINTVRRLSTRSTVSSDSTYLESYYIEWLWYWQDEYGSWIQYAQKNQKGSQSFVDGDELEAAYENYLRKGPSILKFETQKHTYELDFEAMMQKNLVYGTQRPVQRRPKFLSMAERKQIASELQELEKHFGTKNVPKTWDTKGMRPNQPKLVPLDIGRHSDEYMKVADIFWDTMDDKNGTICAIKRVQNFELWEYYSIKKAHMMKKNKGCVNEKQLWHGTSKDSSEAIYRQNFDFRISGSNVGTLYGQGSYFASSAKYSDGYAKPEGHIQRMFLARVLVGRFVEGVQSYKRPPPVDPNNPLGDLYDSCVNDEQNPSIYVTFDKTQAYPEYLIEYKRSSDSNSPLKTPVSSMPKASVSSTAKTNTSRLSASNASAYASRPTTTQLRSSSSTTANRSPSTGNSSNSSSVNSIRTSSDYASKPVGRPAPPQLSSSSSASRSSPGTANSNSASTSSAAYSLSTSSAYASRPTPSQLSSSASAATARVSSPGTANSNSASTSSAHPLSTSSTHVSRPNPSLWWDSDSRLSYHASVTSSSLASNNSTPTLYQNSHLSNRNSPSRSSSSNPSASASNLVRSSSDFGMGRATPSAPIWEDDLEHVLSNARRSLASEQFFPRQSSSDSKKCCIQ